MLYYRAHSSFAWKLTDGIRLRVLGQDVLLETDPKDKFAVKTIWQMNELIRLTKNFISLSIIYLFCLQLIVIGDTTTSWADNLSTIY